MVAQTSRSYQSGGKAIREARFSLEFACVLTFIGRRDKLNKRIYLHFCYLVTSKILESRDGKTERTISKRIYII